MCVTLKGLGPTPYDPACQGMAATYLADYLPKQGAREDIVPPATADQARALSLLQSAGIVIGPGAYANYNASNGVDVVEAQLLKHTAASIGREVGELGALGDAAVEVWRAFSAADKEYALGQIVNAVDLMCPEGPVDLAILADLAGLPLRVAGPTLDEDLVDAGGFVIDGGVPLGLLALDVSAMLGRAQLSSQCDVGNGFEEWYRTSDQRVATQGAFEVAAVLRRALTHINGLTETAGSAALSRQLDSAVSEIAAWAGPGELTYYYFGGATEPMELLLTGMSPADLGVATWDEVADRLAIVSPVIDHSTHLAECAAGLRHEDYCPDDLSDYVHEADSVEPLPDAIANRFAQGYSAYLAMFYGVAPPPGLWPSYLVMKGTPTRTGSVVAALKPQLGQTRFTTVSRLRTELANAVFGVKEPSYQGTTCSGVGEFLDSQRYCIADMPRHMFIPLANELTGSGSTAEDSWRYYLMLAEEAAQKADELGNDLITLGVQRDLRAEAAIEQVGNLCGAYPNVDTFDFDEDNAASSATDTQINECMGEAKYDVVFLTADPFEQTPAGGQALKDAYCATSAERQAPFCGKDAGAIRHAGLNLTQPERQEDTDDGCAIVPLAQPKTTAGGTPMIDLAAFGQLVTERYASQMGLLTTVYALNMTRWEDGWVLKAYNEPIMGDLDAVPTNNEDVWPACQEAGVACTERAMALGELFAADGDEYLPGNQLWEADISLQVEDTLWWLGALAGSMPGCMLVKPLPLVTSAWRPTDKAPLALAYTRGDVESAGTAPDGTPVYRLDVSGSTGLNGADRELVGDAWVPDPAKFERFRLLGRPWLEDLYSTAEPGLYHFWACNDAMTFAEELRHPEESWAVFTRAQLADYLQIAARFAQDGGNIMDVLRDIVAPSPIDVPGCGPVDFLHCGPAYPDFLGYSRGDVGNDPIWPGTGCDDAWGTVPSQPTQNVLVKVGCVRHEYFAPTACSPGARMSMLWARRPRSVEPVLNLKPLARAAGLACHLAHRETALPLEQLPPEINSVQDLQRLEIWVARAADAADDALAVLPLYEVPDRVVEDFLEGRVGGGAVGQGEHGDVLLQYAKALQAIHAGWVSLSSGFRQLNAAINGTRLNIEAAGIARDQAMLGLAREQLELHRQQSLLAVEQAQTMFNMATGFAASVLAKNPFGALGAVGTEVFESQKNAINSTYWNSMGELIEQEPNIVDALHENQVAQALAGLSREAPALYGAIDGALSSIRTAVADAHLAANGLLGSERRAQYAVAMAGGADFVTADDDTLPLHVNTVYRRQFAVTQKRYEDAIKRAKQAAYVARLAIEQRIGMRLENLNSTVGPVTAPALWVDNVCSVQGVNYETLRTADPSAMGGDTFDIGAFAGQYVGDYVAKLKEFIEFYNIVHPFKEGSDSAIVSLREDVGHSGTQCMGQARNLLFESERLFSEGILLEGDQSRLGWRTSPCDETACLEAIPGDGLLNVDGAGVSTPIAGPDGTGAPSWLRTTERGDRDAGDGSVPAATVYQTVDLEAGTQYVLSWWDLARHEDGGPVEPGDDPPPYRAVVYTEDWSVVTSDMFAPSNDAETWSPRRTIAFMVPANAAYHVAFKAAAEDQAGASLAVANVQVEVLTEGPEASAYEPTGRSRTVLTTECKTMGKEGWQQAFRRVCGGDGCYYELKDPIVIDTEALNHGQTSLVGKFAPGNYNYRNGTVALNLVGTGVIDCSDDERMSCYGSGYVEYELEHQASNVKILDNGQDVHCFDFRVGKVRGGKALATERFLTLPMSSADKGLIEQSGFLKGELAGRPLDGIYRLRIKETPALRWENLEDIQLVFNYGYWSAVDVANAL